MYIIGLDLSGPTNTNDTVLVVFRAVSGNTPEHIRTITGAGDLDIMDTITGLPTDDTVIAGLDAPLSYNPGGGDRPADAVLRNKAKSAGLHPGTVMAPTMTRMAYLTLRGVALTRLLLNIPGKSCDIVEVHPGAAMALHGAPVQSVIDLKKEREARINLLAWLEARGLKGIITPDDPGDHYVAACACAFAAWKWHLGRSEWLYPASPPFHPFDVAC